MTLIVLQYIIQFFGNEVLNERYVIEKIINDLFQHDINLRNNLLICI